MRRMGRSAGSVLIIISRTLQAGEVNLPIHLTNRNPHIRYVGEVGSQE
jgi:hypothetical protein